MSSENLNNLSQDELNKILKEEYEKNKKLKKERSIQLIKTFQKQNEKLAQSKSNSNSNSKSKKSKSKSKQKIKTFDEYSQECIKNKTIPNDTPHYLKKALERAMKEYDKGIKHEKSALSNFAEKYVIEGKPGIFPFQFFGEKAALIKDFLRKHRNIKVRIVLICLVERKKYLLNSTSLYTYEEKIIYIHSTNYTNLEKTDVKVLLSKIIYEILGALSEFQREGTGWYYKELIKVEFHTVDYKPMKGSSHIPLPNFIMRKKAIINMENKNDKCLVSSSLSSSHSKKCIKNK